MKYYLKYYWIFPVKYLLSATYKNTLLLLFHFIHCIILNSQHHTLVISISFVYLTSSHLSVSLSACLGNPLMVGRGQWIMAVSSHRLSRCQEPSQVIPDPGARTLGSTQPCYGWMSCRGRSPTWAHRCALTAACRATESTNDWSES